MNRRTIVKKELILGTRSSRLALWQAGWVKGRLEEQHQGLKIILLTIKTTGDKITDVPLAKVGGKGLFVKEIEEALMNGRIDLAVHSMKDVPTDLPHPLHLIAVTEREDPRDVLISRGGLTLKELNKGAFVGTSSLRRKAQLLNLRHDLEVLGLRGNVETRLRKLSTGGLDAIVLAAAGVKRMELGSRITEFLSTEVFLPAIGQGALGIETRVEDEDTNNLVRSLNHKETSLCVEAERSFLRRLEGGCQVPIAGHCKLNKEKLTLQGIVGELDGSLLLRDKITGPIGDPGGLGVKLAESLLERGADGILQRIYGLKGSS